MNLDNEHLAAEFLKFFIFFSEVPHLRSSDISFWQTQKPHDKMILTSQAVTLKLSRDIIALWSVLT